MRIEFNHGEKDTFPWATFGLLGFFILIGILDYDGSSLSTLSPSYVSINIMDPELRLIYSLKPVFALQWQLFTYNLIHFAIVHYAYSGLLLAYYIGPFERVTSKKFVLIAYYASAVIWPIIGGIIFYIAINLYPPWAIYITDIAHLNFLGSSVGIWGVIGLASPYQWKRRLYWVPVFFLLILEFTLKLIVGRTDLATNVLHVITFFAMWALSSKILRIKTENGQIGGYTPRRRSDWLIIAFCLLCAVVLIWHTLYTFSLAGL